MILDCASPTTIAFSTPISITRDVALDASSSPAAIIITGDNKTQLFDVRASLTLNSLTLEQGRSEAASCRRSNPARRSLNGAQHFLSELRHRNLSDGPNL